MYGIHLVMAAEIELASAASFLAPVLKRGKIMDEKIDIDANNLHLPQSLLLQPKADLLLNNSRQITAARLIEVDHRPERLLFERHWDFFWLSIIR